MVEEPDEHERRSSEQASADDVARPVAGAREVRLERGVGIAEAPEELAQGNETGDERTTKRPPLAAPERSAWRCSCMVTSTVGEATANRKRPPAAGDAPSQLIGPGVCVRCQGEPVRKTTGRLGASAVIRRRRAGGERRVAAATSPVTENSLQDRAASALSGHATRCDRRRRHPRALRRRCMGLRRRAGALRPGLTALRLVPPGPSPEPWLRMVGVVPRVNQSVVPTAR